MGYKARLRRLFGLTPKKKLMKKLSAEEYQDSYVSSSGFSPGQDGMNPENSMIEEKEESLEYHENNFRGRSANSIVYLIDIFHDAENCPVKLHTNGSKLYDSVIRKVLNAVGVDTNGLDIESTCDVHWRFVLPLIEGSGRIFPTRCLKDLLTRGVLHINPGEKKGAVDIVIKDSMDRLRAEHFDDSAIKKQRRIVVLISGDKDFAANIR
eukprot:CAMPEP_0119050324 /NCGR_PEP_ID=MMETSP1177-20130426/69259_1 /TAXON_ID=2985 /ORGANISM="Ochromonas sp, Strain CCMP1899" /LENGTH=208 /DNA_ID=CAMNT_0007028589 /DNA_START=87 /DNA_END=710 /DNA_ORIENTATION=-